jgi:hypothetical protein
MATALVIEEEAGTSSGFVHPHNGYYAGDFHRAEPTPVLAAVFVRFTDDDGVAASALEMVPSVLHIDDHAVPQAA